MTLRPTCPSVPATATPVLLLVLALALGGCATVRTLPPKDLKPAHELTVFTDGFHSGVVLDKQSLPADFDPRSGDEPAGYPQISLHFGEERWTAGLDNSLIHAVGLAFVPGSGVIESDHTRTGLVDIPGLRLDHLRVWTFPVDQSGIEHLVAGLRSEWMTGVVMPRPPGEASSIYLSPKSWSVFHNCHDFTIDMLRLAGLDLRGRWIYVAGGLATDLDDASAELEEAGVRVIGFGPAAASTAAPAPAPAPASASTSATAPTPGSASAPAAP